MNNTTFSDNTPEELKDVINALAIIPKRLRVKVYHEGIYDRNGEGIPYTYEESGYIGRTTGNHSPILVFNSRSDGGFLLNTRDITRIDPSNKKHGNIPYYVKKED